MVAAFHSARHTYLPQGPPANLLGLTPNRPLAFLVEPVELVDSLALEADER